VKMDGDVRSLLKCQIKGVEASTSFNLNSCIGDAPSKNLHDSKLQR
jgi:hypothetical protein